MAIFVGSLSGTGASARSVEHARREASVARHSPRGAQDLRSRVQLPVRGPWRPPAPPLALDTPLMMPNLETLARVLAALHKL